MSANNPLDPLRSAAAIKAVSKVWRIDRAHLLGHCRTEPMAEARKAIYAVSRRLGVSWWNIAKATGRRSHQTVIHGANATDWAIKHNPVLAMMVDEAEAIAREAMKPETQAQAA